MASLARGFEKAQKGSSQFAEVLSRDFVTDWKCVMGKRKHPRMTPRIETLGLFCEFLTS